MGSQEHPPRQQACQADRWVGKMLTTARLGPAAALSLPPAMEEVRATEARARSAWRRRRPGSEDRLRDGAGFQERRYTATTLRLRAGRASAEGSWACSPSVGGTTGGWPQEGAHTEVQPLGKKPQSPGILGSALAAETLGPAGPASKGLSIRRGVGAEEELDVGGHPSDR